MSDEKLPNASGNLQDLPNADHTGRVRTAVHEELQANSSELMGVLRRWWLIAVTVGAAVWGVAGYLGGKANAEDVENLKHAIEHNAARIAQVEARFSQLDRIEAQLYQLALRSGAPIVTQSK